jgi:hypothetical protein
VNCARCLLPLPPGASHARPEDCISALTHALATATRCRTCGTDVKVVIHPACVAKAGARVAVDKAVDKGVEKIMEGLFGLPSSPQQGDGGGKKFDPS